MIGLNIIILYIFTGRIPFAFLEDIYQRFVRTYGRAVLSAQAYGMNDEFSRVLSQQMEYYSNDPNADRINRLKGEMSQVSLNIFDANHIFIQNDIGCSIYTCISCC